MFSHNRWLVWSLEVVTDCLTFSETQRYFHKTQNIFLYDHKTFSVPYVLKTKWSHFIVMKLCRLCRASIQHYYYNFRSKWEVIVFWLWLVNVRKNLFWIKMYSSNTKNRQLKNNIYGRYQNCVLWIRTQTLSYPGNSHVHFKIIPNCSWGFY